MQGEGQLSPFFVGGEKLNQDTRYFTARDVAGLITSTPLEVARMGQVIIPDVPSDGRGYKSLYSFRNMVEMRLGEELSNIGVAWKRIYKYIEELRRSHGRWLEQDGLDGWLVLDRFWKWGAGTTLDMAIDSVFKDRPQDVIVAVNVGMIKRALRNRMTRDGDSLTDEEFNETVRQIEDSGKTFNSERS